MTTGRWPYANDGASSHPVMTLEIFRPYSPAGAAIDLVIDTGSDVTAIPLALLAELGAPAVDRGTVTAFGGASVRIDIYHVEIVVLERPLGRFRVIADTTGDGLVGLDVLNLLQVDLNGPAGVTTITT